MPVPGRITMFVLEGKELLKHDRATGAVKGTKIDPYLKVQLGVGKRAPKKKSQPLRNTNKNPIFAEQPGQELTFDVINPAELVANGMISFHVAVHHFIFSPAFLPAASAAAIPSASIQRL